jgi:hypothetical protein
MNAESHLVTKEQLVKVVRRRHIQARPPGPTDYSLLGKLRLPEPVVAAGRCEKPWRSRAIAPVGQWPGGVGAKFHNVSYANLSIDLNLALPVYALARERPDRRYAAVASASVIF